MSSRSKGPWGKHYTWVNLILRSASQWNVYTALCSFADQSRQCWPTLSQLEERTGLGDRAIKRATRELEELGLIIKRSGRGRGRPTLYILLEHAPERGQGCPLSKNKKGDTRGPGNGVCQNDTKGDPRCSPPLNRPPKVKGYLGQEVAVGREGDSTGFGGSREGAEVIHLADLLQANRERQSSQDFSSAESANEFAEEETPW